MCDPVSMMIAGTAISAGGQLIQGAQQSAAAERNAKMADYQGQVAEEQGKFKIEQAQRAFTLHQGQADAAIADSGISHESFDYVLRDDAQQSALEQAAIKYGTKQESYQMRYQADSYRINAKDAEFSAVVGAVGTSLQGATNVMKYRALNPSQGFSSGTGVSAGGNFDSPQWNRRQDQ